MFMYFFFFKQKTAYEMRISDWSSDVCSSDLRSAQEARMHDLLSIRRKPRRRVSRRTDMADRGSGPAAPLPTGGSRHAAQDAARVRDAPATPQDRKRVG